MSKFLSNRYNDENVRHQDGKAHVPSLQIPTRRTAFGDISNTLTDRMVEKGKYSKPSSTLSSLTSRNVTGRINVFGSKPSSSTNPSVKSTKSKSYERVSKPAAPPSVGNAVAPVCSSSSSPRMDRKEKNNPQACVSLLKDIFAFYKKKEGKDVASPNYMSKQSDINEKMRAILIDWLVDVHYKFKLKPETLYLTINIIDRFLEQKLIMRQKLQLVGVTAMLIAAKYEEIYAPEVRDFVYISAKAYTRDEILKMERLMLATLNFGLTVATPYCFKSRYLKAGEADERMSRMSDYFTELAMVDYRMLRYLPSEITAASVFLARKYVGHSSGWTSQLEYYTEFAEEALMPCISDMNRLVKSAPTDKLQAVHKKYSSSKQNEIAKSVSKMNVDV